MAKKNKAGLTIVVVIAIIGLLATILAPFFLAGGY